MQTFDIIAIAVYSLLIGIGVYRGFIKEVFQIAAMLGGFAGGYLLYPLFALKISFISKSEGTVTVLAFVAAFLICFIIILAIGWMIKKLVHMTPLGWIDRLIGGFSGFLKASILLIVFVLSMNALPDFKLKEAFSESASFKAVDKLPFVLKSVRSKKVQGFIDAVKESDPAEKIKDLKKHKDVLEKGKKTVEKINKAISDD